MKLLKPTWLIYTVSHITPEQLKKKDIETVLIDLDNTLVPWNRSESPAELKEWVDKIKSAHISVVIVSNNRSKRVKQIADSFGLPYVSNAKKPTPGGFYKAFRLVGADKQKSVIIGDQLFTDVFGGNLFGIKTILVKPLVASDLLITRFNRQIEKYILKKMIEKAEIEWRDTIE